MNAEAVHVLVVDDDASIHERLANLLRDHYSYVMDIAPDGGSALRQINQAERPYHVVVVNDSLSTAPGARPRPLGINLLTQIKSLCPQTELISLTGENTEQSGEAL